MPRKIESETTASLVRRMMLSFLDRIEKNRSRKLKSPRQFLKRFAAFAWKSYKRANYCSRTVKAREEARGEPKPTTKSVCGKRKRTICPARFIAIFLSNPLPCIRACHHLPNRASPAPKKNQSKVFLQFPHRLRASLFAKEIQ